MTGEILTAFAPVFALVALGYAVRASGLMPRELWGGINALNHRILLPAFLFALIARSDLTAPGAAGLAAVALAGGALLFTAAWLASTLLRSGRSETAALIAVAMLWNLVLTVALADRLLGPEAADRAAALVAPGVILGAGAAVAAFAFAGAGSAGGALRRVAADPVVIACAAGALASLFGVLDAVPGLLAPLDMLGAGAMAVILLAMGAGLDLPALRGRLAPIAAAAALRSVAGPAIFITLAVLIGLDDQARVIAALAGAAPGAAFTYAVAADFRTEAPLVAGMLTLSVLTSLLALPVAAAIALSL
ncbi:MAG: AEC family transporter [Oceanicaulis sp.]